MHYEFKLVSASWTTVQDRRAALAQVRPPDGAMVSAAAAHLIGASPMERQVSSTSGSAHVPSKNGAVGL